MSKTGERMIEVLNQSKRMRGLDREAYFKAGGSLVQWRGGTRTVTKNKKREASRLACRRNNVEE